MLSTCHDQGMTTRRRRIACTFNLFDINYIHILSKEIKLFTTIDELEAFMLKHGESIVDLMGGEIDRIEMKIRVSEI